MTDQSGIMIDLNSLVNEAKCVLGIGSERGDAAPATGGCASLPISSDFSSHQHPNCNVSIATNVSLLSSTHSAAGVARVVEGKDSSSSVDSSSDNSNSRGRVGAPFSTTPLCPGKQQCWSH